MLENYVTDCQPTHHHVGEQDLCGGRVPIKFKHKERDYEKISEEFKIFDGQSMADVLEANDKSNTGGSSVLPVPPPIGIESESYIERTVGGVHVEHESPDGIMRLSDGRVFDPGFDE